MKTFFVASTTPHYNFTAICKAHLVHLANKYIRKQTISKDWSGQDGLPDIPTLYVSSKATVKGQAFAIRFLNAVILQQQEGLKQAFFKTPLGTSGVGKSSRTLSFLLEFRVFCLSFKYFPLMFSSIF